MPNPRSAHYPEVAGGEITVTGEALVDTTLYRGLLSFTCAFKGQNFVPDQEAYLSWYPYVLPDGTEQLGKVIIRVEKGGINNGLLGTNPVVVSWIAIGA